MKIEIKGQYFIHHIDLNIIDLSDLDEVETFCNLKLVYKHDLRFFPSYSFLDEAIYKTKNTICKECYESFKNSDYFNGFTYNRLRTTNSKSNNN